MSIAITTQAILNILPSICSFNFPALRIFYYQLSTKKNGWEYLEHERINLFSNIGVTQNSAIIWRFDQKIQKRQPLSFCPIRLKIIIIILYSFDWYWMAMIILLELVAKISSLVVEVLAFWMDWFSRCWIFRSLITCWKSATNFVSRWLIAIALNATDLISKLVKDV